MSEFQFVLNYLVNYPIWTLILVFFVSSAYFYAYQYEKLPLEVLTKAEIIRNGFVVLFCISLGVMTYRGYVYALEIYNEIYNNAQSIKDILSIAFTKDTIPNYVLTILVGFSTATIANTIMLAIDIRKRINKLTIKIKSINAEMEKQNIEKRNISPVELDSIFDNLLSRQYEIIYKLIDSPDNRVLLSATPYVKNLEKKNIIYCDDDDPGFDLMVNYKDKHKKVYKLTSWALMKLEKILAFDRSTL